MTNLVEKELSKASRQKGVEATYSVFDLDGERYFQIDTYGSPDRQLVGKRSQSLRLNKDTATALISLLKQEFDI